MSEPPPVQPPAGAPWLKEYPFSGYTLRLSHGARMHYLDEGPREAAPALLCVHGNPTWSFYWRSLVASERTHRRVIAPDHIGMGLSDKPQPGAYSHTLRQRIDDLEALWIHLGRPAFDLVAYDWGGAIGLGLARRHPEALRRITLLNTAAYTDSAIPLRIAFCRWGWLGRIAVRQFNAFAGTAPRFASSRKGGVPEPARSGLLFPYGNWNDRAAVHEFVRDIPMRPSHRSWATLKEIENSLVDLGRNRPIQLLWGCDDFCFHEHFLWRFVEFWPHARIDRLQGVGHYVMEDAPDEALRRIRDFHARHPVRS